MSKRFLTQTEKTRELLRWEELKTNLLEKITSGKLQQKELGGLGYPDPEVYDLCDRLNSIPSICTLQSCSGHIHRDDLNNHMWTGALWIKPTNLIRNRFVGFAPMLLNSPDIERTSLFFHRELGDVIEIIFHGLNYNKATLRRSSNTIVKFFHSICYNSDGG